MSRERRRIEAPLPGAPRGDGEAPRRSDAVQPWSRERSRIEAPLPGPSRGDGEAPRRSDAVQP
jgi:hypothetical protein